jgi:syntaxin-binding protein 5
MDHPIITMLPLNSTPYASISPHPSAIAVLLKNDLLVVDMTAQGLIEHLFFLSKQSFISSYPCFEIPHPMDLHESPVTILKYYSDCPLEMIAALTLAGRNQRRQGVLSDKQWPISGLSIKEIFVEFSL